MSVGLQRRDPKVLFRTEHKCGTGVKQARSLRVAHPAEEFDAPSGEPLEASSVGPVAGDDDAPIQPLPR